MSTTPLTLRETRTYAAIAAATALTASAGLGATTGLLTSPTAGLVTGAVAALASLAVTLNGLRLAVTCPEA